MLPLFPDTTRLKILDAADNDLDGNLDPVVLSLGNLEVLSVHDNTGITGNLTVLCDGMPSTLVELQLANTGVVGPLSPACLDYPYLRQLNLDSMELGGTLPTELGLLGSLESMSIANSGLTGEIPRELSMLNQTLQTLNLANNFLEGHVPIELNDLMELDSLDLSYNQLSGSLQPLQDIAARASLVSVAGNRFDDTSNLCDEYNAVGASGRVVLNECSALGTADELPCDCCSSCSRNE